MMLATWMEEVYSSVALRLFKLPSLDASSKDGILGKDPTQIFWL